MKNKNSFDDFNLNDITTVVVIGYSFPYYNREIDDIIFSEIAYHNELKIYLQYPDGEHDAIEEKVRTLTTEDAKIIHVSSGNFFYIPNEFYNVKRLLEKEQQDRGQSDSI